MSKVEVRVGPRLFIPLYENCACSELHSCATEHGPERLGRYGCTYLGVHKLMGCPPRDDIQPTSAHRCISSLKGYKC